MVSNKNKMLVCVFIVILVSGIGLLTVVLNPITEGHYVERRGIEISSVGSHTQLDVMEVDNTVAYLHSPEDEMNYMGTIEANESAMFNIRDFEENPPGLRFIIYFLDYSVVSMDYRLSSGKSITIEIDDVNLTITTDVVYNEWISIEAATSNQIGMTILSCVIFCLLPILIVGYTMLPNNIYT